jgi:hypothetical protein
VCTRARAAAARLPAHLRLHPALWPCSPTCRRFLEEVKNDPWGASHCHSQADRLEELEEGAAGPGADLALEDGGAGTLGTSMLTTVDDKNSAVVVINSVGIIQMANKVGSFSRARHCCAKAGAADPRLELGITWRCRLLAHGMSHGNAAS